MSDSWVLRYADPNDPLGMNHVTRDIALDLLDTRAEVDRLTAEVERLRGVVEEVAVSASEILFYHEQHTVAEAEPRFRLRVLGPLRAALTPPAPTREQETEG